MKEAKPQIGGPDYYILMSALWRDSTGGATYKDLINIFDGFAGRPLPHDVLATGLAFLETAGLIRFTGERVIPTEKARALYSKIQEIRDSPDYGADPTRYGGEKLARIVASGASEAYEEFELLLQALMREYPLRPMGPRVDGGGGPRHPLYSEELHRKAQEEIRVEYQQFMETYRRKAQEKPRIEQEQVMDTHRRKKAQEERRIDDEQVMDTHRRNSSWLQRITRWFTE